LEGYEWKQVKLDGKEQKMEQSRQVDEEYKWRDNKKLGEEAKRVQASPSRCAGEEAKRVQASPSRCA
jgi:hypothetical protein